MALVPTSYTNDTLRHYMLDVLQSVGPAAAWSAEDMDEQLIDVLLVCGVASAADETNVRKLRGVAAYYAWDKLVTAVSGDFSFAADGGQYTRKQVYDMAKERLQAAREKAAEWLDATESGDPSSTVLIGRIRHSDPYSLTYADV